MTGGNGARRILQVGSGFSSWGGAELHMVNLATALASRGNDVIVAARPGEFVARETERRGLKTVGLTCCKQQDWRDSAGFRRLLRTFRPHIVHVHTSYDYFVAPVLARLSGVPVVLMSRHVPFRIKPGLSRFLYGKAFFTRIIALSDSVRQTLLASGIDAAKIVTIHHGTDTDAFRAQSARSSGAIRAEWNIPTDAFLVGMAGRLIPDKGVAVFLEALATRPDAFGVVIGDGPLEAELRAYTAAVPGLAARIVFAGFRADIADAIGALDALVLASTWAEPCAAVVQQAMALSKPVIGTNIGGTPEMVGGGETGLLVPPGDALALAAAIATLAADPGRRERMGAAGRTRVESCFTLAGMTDKVEDLYGMLLSQAARNS